MKKDTKINPELFQRVITFLTRGQVDLLDKIGKDALFSKGTKLSRTKIISCMIDLLSELETNGEGVSSLAGLKERIKEKISLTWPTTREIIVSGDGEAKQLTKDVRNSSAHGSVPTRP